MSDERGCLLYVLNDPAYFLSHRLSLAESAQKAGWDVHVATPPGPAAAKVRAASFPHHAIPLTRRGLRPDQEFLSIVALLRLVRRLQPELVHLLTIKPILYGGLACRIARVPSVVHAVTGLGYVFSSPGSRAAVLRAAARQGFRTVFRHPNARVIFQNPDDLALLVGEGVVRPEKAVLIRGSGVDTAMYRPRDEPPGPPVIALPSRMLWDKGVKEFVEAARVLRAEGASARFVLVGDTDTGNPSAVPRAQLQAWAAEGAVEWWGWRGDMVGVLQQVHVVVLPSAYGEGVPKVLLEAASCARPIVTTDAPGCREIVRHGENGLLVPPRDAEALAAALRLLLDDPDLRRKLGRRGRERVEAEFTLQRVVGETLRVYDDLRSRASSGNTRIGS